MGPAAGEARAIARSAAGLGNVDRWVGVTVSVAVVGAAVLAAADAAMYAAKRTGRDRTVVADGVAVAAA